MKENFEITASNPAAERTSAQSLPACGSAVEPNQANELKTLVRESSGFEHLDVFKARLNIADAAALTNASDGETLASCIRRTVLESEGKGDFAKAAVAGLKGEILEAHLQGEPIDGMFGWDRAAGKKIEDVWLLYPADQEKSPAVHVILFLGARALVLSTKMNLYLLSGGVGTRFGGEFRKSAGKLLPELVGRKIASIKPIGPGSCHKYPVSYMITLDDGTVVALQAHCEGSSESQAGPRIQFTILRPIEADWSDIKTDKPMTSGEYKCADYRTFLV